MKTLGKHDVNVSKLQKLLERQHNLLKSKQILLENFSLNYNVFVLSCMNSEK